MEDIIRVTNLRRYFGQIKAVDDISFRVKKGELYGFLGVNGAGKSTTIKILCTILKCQEGEVEICGYALGKEDYQIRKKIGVVFQENTLDDRLTVKENLIMRASLYENSRNTIKENLTFACDVLGIQELLGRQYYRLSGGQRRRCEVAKALMSRPEILFLDEPTTGLDPQTRQKVWDSIEHVRKELGMTIFLTTHYMEEAAKAQYISIMEEGKLIATGTPSQLKQQYAHDMLRLVPIQPEDLKTYLINKNINFEEKSNHIQLQLSDTLSSLELLNSIKNNLNSFEVIQGTMDDVFLNATGKSLKEV